MARSCALFWVFHADPHSGNIFLNTNENPLLTVLDFGASETLKPIEQSSARLFGLGVELRHPAFLYTGLRILTQGDVDGNPTIKQELYGIFKNPHLEKSQLNQKIFALIQKHNIPISRQFLLFFRAEDYFKKQFREINGFLSYEGLDRKKIRDVPEKVIAYLTGVYNHGSSGFIDLMATGLTATLSLFEYMKEMKDLQKEVNLLTNSSTHFSTDNGTHY